MKYAKNLNYLLMVREIIIFESYLTNIISIFTYENEEHKTSGDSNFRKRVEIRIELVDTNMFFIMSKHIYNNKISEEDNFKTAMYNYIKILEQYSNYEDC